MCALALICASCTKDDQVGIGDVLGDDGISGSDGGASAADGGTTGGGGSGDGGAGTGTGDGGSGSDGGGIKYDVGSTQTGNPEDCDPWTDPECGCTFVDLLFIVDNSVSMNDYQVALGQAFPTFAEEIVDVLPPGTNLHVGVTSTEMKYSSSGSTTNCTATGDDGQPASAFYVTPDQENTGVNGAQGRLYEAGGLVYFDMDTDAPQAEIDGLGAWFAQAAHIGDAGSQVEMSSAPAGWAMHQANDATNAGFVRDEGAVLVLFWLQDEPDQTPGTASQEIVEMITAAKEGCGGMDCVVGGGYVNEYCLDQVPLGALFDAFGDEPIIETLPPENGLNADSFTPVLRDTLAQVIAQKCEEIAPPQG